MLEDEEMMLYNFKHDVLQRQGGGVPCLHIYTTCRPKTTLSPHQANPAITKPKKFNTSKAVTSSYLKQVRDAADRDLASVG
jgi:hypothetical protein